MRARPHSRRELALVAAALLLPIPLLAASGLMVPLPSAVERAFVSLLPGGEVETGPSGGQPVSTSSRSSTAGGGEANRGSGDGQDSVGVLSEGGNATSPAADGAAGSDDSAADNVLPGNERLLPGGGESELPAAPINPGGSTGPGSDTGGETTPAPDDRTVSAVASVSPEGVTVDTSAATAVVAGSTGATVGVSPQDGVTLTIDADQDETSGDSALTVPVSLPAIPLP